MVDLLAKACAHAGIKAIGVKTTVITSAIFAVNLLNLKKKKKKKKEGEEEGGEGEEEENVRRI